MTDTIVKGINLLAKISELIENTLLPLLNCGLIGEAFGSIKSSICNDFV